MSNQWNVLMFMQLQASSMIHIQSDDTYVSLFYVSCRNSFNYVQPFAFRKPKKWGKKKSCTKHTANRISKRKRSKTAFENYHYSNCFLWAGCLPTYNYLICHNIHTIKMEVWTAAFINGCLLCVISQYNKHRAQLKWRCRGDAEAMWPSGTHQPHDEKVLRFESSRAPSHR